MNTVLPRTKNGVVTCRDFLRKRSEEVEPHEIRDIAAELRKAFDNQVNCAGLAAVQIGILKRMAIYKTPSGTIGYIVNPVIIRRCGPIQSNQERCMSLPSTRLTIHRPYRVTVQTEKQEVCFLGFQAAVIMHEIDHMNGITIFDRLKEYRKTKKAHRK